jgi:nucleoside-diphosphate-sugar epimerase
MRCLVAGAGGFIGGHLVQRLLNEGHTVRAVDIKCKSNWWQWHEGAENWAGLDLKDKRSVETCFPCYETIDRVYNLAADMGGIGFIENNKCDCMLSVLINTHLLQVARAQNVGRFFYASSACVYHADIQNETTNTPLKESDAYYCGGAMPEDGYGWEKLFSERMCRHFREDYSLETRVARFHNIFGPQGSWKDGREKAPAALCRKVATAIRDKEPSIDIWGDGTITRSFCYVDDCIEGILRLTESDHNEPLNIGSDESVSINELLTTIENKACYVCERNYDTTKPQGVNGRNSDNTICKQVLGWSPTTTLKEGIAKTYPWIEEQVTHEH